MTEYNRRISELLFEIEATKGNYVTDIAYDYIYHWCDNMEDCYNGDSYDFSNASWGVSEETIIEYLTNLLK